MDSQCSDLELHYLRGVYRKHVLHNDVHSVILQNLWDVYGLTFNDKTLLYGVVLSAVAGSFRSPGQHPLARVHYLTYKSLFHNSLMNGIKANQISECQLFGLFFAICGGTVDRDTSLADVRVYQQGLVEVMQVLRRQTHPGASQKSSLSHLYYYMFSYVRRISDESDVVLEDAVTSSVFAAPYQLYRVAESIPLPLNIPDLRATAGLPISFWLERGVGYLNGLQLLWAVWNDIQALRGALLLILCPTGQNVYFREVSHILRLVSNNITDIQSLPCVADLFQEVSSSLLRITDDRFSSLTPLFMFLQIAE
jgi:hypothetical protein